MNGFVASVALVAILLGVLLLVAFDVYCLARLAAADRVRFVTKSAWAAVILFISPVGGAAYLLSLRTKRLPGPPVPVPHVMPH